MRTLRVVPWALIGLRLALGPAVVIGACFGVPAWVLVVALWTGVVSDIFDGIVARRAGCATATLRRCDSQTDLVFFACIIAACFVREWGALLWWTPLIAGLIVLEGVCYAVSLARFGREPCTHAYSAKVFGLVFLAALTIVLGWSETGAMFGMMIAVGYAMQVDCVLIGVLLPRWEKDVPSSLHAWRLRRGMSIRRHALFHSS